MERLENAAHGGAGAATFVMDAQLEIDIPEGTPRPLAILSEYVRRYPRARKLAERLRADRGSEGFIDWPECCYAPLGAAQAIVRVERGGLPLDTGRALDAAVLSALMPWRMTKGIYRFDPDVLQSVWHTPVTSIPVGVLRSLPQWCCYVEIPPVSPATAFDPPDWHKNLRGFFVHLDWDVGGHHAELRLVLDRETGVQPLVINLDAPTVRGCWRSKVKEELILAGLSEEAAEASLSSEAAEFTASKMTELHAPLVSVALYLCSAEIGVANARDPGGETRPGNPEPRRTKKHGEKLFAAKDVREWKVT